MCVCVCVCVRMHTCKIHENGHGCALTLTLTHIRTLSAPLASQLEEELPGADMFLSRLFLNVHEWAVQATLHALFKALPFCLLNLGLTHSWSREPSTT